MTFYRLQRVERLSSFDFLVGLQAVAGLIVTISFLPMQVCTSHVKNLDMTLHIEAQRKVLYDVIVHRQTCTVLC